ncbi:hypothetical protein P691DRAFT_788131 [Macrolepiota fuliginosa MF-IS2]|uniref:Glycan binding protein Y3-like domain-containing protein n=1 Tax=Macrolepiota fuliginosa MF-IS2 TaxID=1400762 RepID=A0A9P5X4S8_9AGAR|nr:hypothetical protein P691DRAFT_788131 [Macrolepiota fuliginosa MF-IS2]
MFIKLVFIANLLAVALAQNITCLTGGYAPATQCTQFVNTFCDAVDPESLRLKNSNGRCFNLANGNRYSSPHLGDFMAFNTYQDNASPSGTNCKSILENVTKQCKYGGNGKITDASPAYTFVVDVNVGPCNINI